MTLAWADAVRQFSGARVLVVGDVMLDRYIIGSVTRISPEAPVPIVRVEREDEMPGGAGNTARNVAALGASCTLIGLVGEDTEAQQLSALLDRAGIKTKLVSDGRRRTTVKTRIVAQQQQIVRADREALADIDGEVEEAVLGVLGDELATADIVVVSDYGKGLLTRRVLERLFRGTRDAGVPSISDPTGSDLGRYRGTTFLKPNRHEILLATGVDCTADDEAERAGRIAIEMTGAEAVLISRSERGISVIESAEAVHLRAEAREVFDVSGAGDTVVAACAVALAAGADIVMAASIANAAAGLVVGKLGTAVVRSEELVRALSRMEDASAGKVVDLDRAAARVQSWKAQGLSIGFTNGCFDLLHPGHVSLLVAAKAECDRLVVAINDDQSVRRLKGEGRPVTGQEDRAAVLASLETVDLVTVFSEDTPIRAIDALRPAVLVKGGDYTVDQVVGRELVEGYGGRVRIAPYVRGHSTTSTIGRIGRREG